MLLVEVTSSEKDCKVLLNMDLVIEIAPLKNGGSAIFYSDNAAVNGKTAVQVKESYDMFKQFAVHTVSSDDIARKIAALKPPVPTQVNDQITDSVTQAIAPQVPARRIPGRKKPGRKPGVVYPKKVIETTTGDEANG